MIQLLTDIVLIITGFQLILLAVVLLTQKNINRLNRNLLVAFLLSKAFLIIRWFSFRFEIVRYNDLPYIYLITGSVFFLLAPLLYFYIKSLCYKDFPLNKHDFFHLIPFLVFIFFSIMSIQLELSQAGTEFRAMGKIFISYYWDIFWTCNFIQIISYIIAMVRTIYVYQIKIKNHYSSVETINLNWFVTLLVVITLHWLFVVSRATLSILNITVGNLINIIDLFSITIFLVFTTILVIKGLNQLKVFSGIDEKLKYANSKLPESEMQRYVQQLTQCMKTQKPYLIPSLTIDDLSQKLSISSWQLSQVINNSFHQNFFNFINKYRIEEAKRLMVVPSNRKKTILEILYEVGFNSKSTFNDVFKKYTGMTPSEFKRLNRN